MDSFQPWSRWILTKPKVTFLFSLFQLPTSNSTYLLGQRKTQFKLTNFQEYYTFCSLNIKVCANCFLKIIPSWTRVTFLSLKTPWRLKKSQKSFRYITVSSKVFFLTIFISYFDTNQRSLINCSFWVPALQFLTPNLNLCHEFIKQRHSK